MTLDRIAKISLAVSFVEHALILGIVFIVIAIPAAKYIPMIEVDMINSLTLSDMLSTPSQPSGGQKTPDAKPPETVKTAVTPNVAKPSDNKLKPSDIGVTKEASASLAGVPQEGSISSTLDMVGSGLAENVRFSAGKVSGFSFTGTGIVTAKPDNVFIQFSVKSGLQNSLRSAENEALKKVDFMTYNIGRLFKVKKEDFKVYGFDPEMVQQTLRVPNGLIERDNDGNIVAKTRIKYNVTKFVVVGNLGTKKFLDVCEMLDKAVDYGAIAVAEIPNIDGGVAASANLGKAAAQVNAVKGASKLKFTAIMNNPNNQLINYHFNEDTLEKLMKTAKDAAYKEAKDKVAKIKAVLKFKDTEMDINFNESTNVVSDEEGTVNIRVDVTANLNRNAAAAAAGTGDPGVAAKKGESKPDE